MFRRIFYKGVAAFIIIFVCSLLMSYRQTLDDGTVTFVKERDMGFIYERIGSDKGIFYYDELGEVNKISELYGDNTYIDRDVKVSTINEGKNQGIYVGKTSDKMLNNTVNILKGYRVISEIDRFSDNIYMVCSNDKERVLLTYDVNMGTSSNKTLPIGDSDYIRDVKFVKESEIIYSKKHKTNPDSYNIYSYNIATNKENKIINCREDILDPMLSPNKQNISYLKRENGVYQLYIYEIKYGAEKRINLNDGVVSGSTRWSLDNNYILCNTFNEGALNRLNIVNLNSGKLTKINNAYSGIFNVDSTAAFFASYSKEERIQYIYFYDLKSNNKKEVYRIYEEGSFSKSIRLLKVY
ncbi:MAG: hypothetical protein RR539_00020 [Clostridium sp.]|uniref:TolB family protein n=2 Tax=Clostridium sp. TaxID=1506 RepID=UPI002FCA2FE0